MLITNDGLCTLSTASYGINLIGIVDDGMIIKLIAGACELMHVTHFRATTSFLSIFVVSLGARQVRLGPLANLNMFI